MDVIVVGAGPNGLAAAIALAREGRSVRVYEANDTVGGGCRSAELTVPGAIHDTCSAIHPLAASSPFFGELPLREHGLEWIHPPAPLAHPLDDGTAVMLERSVDETARGLGRDGAAWRRVVGGVARDWGRLRGVMTGPVLQFPRHPLALARFGTMALLPAATLAGIAFRDTRARALFAGCAAHSFLPFDAPLSASFGLGIAASGHSVGWPLARGGSQRIADALASHLRSLGGEIVTGERVTTVAELPAARAYLFDTSPRDLDRIAAARLPGRYRRALRSYRYGPGVFKLDLLLDGPIPWRAAECARAGTVHLGGTFEELAEAEREVARGGHPERPFVLVAQQSLFDPSRAPAGAHTVWAYCHVPNGSTVDMTERILGQLERFAPGLRDRITARHAMGTADVERRNANYVGGDISCGSHSGIQFLARPMVRAVPYETPARDIYLCSAATPPGGGVHGMSGFHAARAALRRAFA
ncbi:MAG TPA: NAD(P)/FAD-dependent oxidoreductase [Candidatus Limnocylindria bacterium]|nr:NAD(P)/FAD-dependent oxidoreductase [Candidatus Limnocylindria bacterium]